MKAIILARVSTEEQREANNSLPAQIDRIKAYCVRNKFEVVETFSFDESAYGTKRDEFDKILEYLQSSKEKLAICFDKVDRLSRNVFDKRVGILYDKAVADEIELHFVSDGQVVGPNMSAVEKFHFGISLGLAKYYSDAISDNVIRTFEKKRREGAWLGVAPLGYLNVGIKDEKRDIVPDPEREHLVRNMFEMYSTGLYSLDALVKKITDTGLRTRKGYKPYRSHIEKILHDPFYYGVAHSKKHNILYPHKYEPIISKELFDKCQEVGKDRGRKRSKEISREFIFKGLLSCKKCGCTITPELKKGKFVYYSCTNAKGICKREYVPEKELLNQVQNIFDIFKAIPQEVQDKLVNELRDLNHNEADFHKRQLDRVKTEYDRVQNRLNGLLDLFLDQSITKDEYDKKMQELKDRQYGLGLELEKLTQADHEYHIHVSTVLSLALRMGEIFNSSEPDEKRAILNFVLQNPTLEDRKLSCTLKKPFDLVQKLAEPEIGNAALTPSCPLWQGRKELNPHQPLWRRLYYRCTTPL